MPQPPAQLPGYDEFLAAIKERVRVVRQRAIAAANQELLRGYWEIGAEILRRQQQEGWGARVHRPARRRSADRVPGRQGLLVAQLEVHARVRGGLARGPICARRLAQISWYHHLALLDKLDDPELRVWYGAKAAQNGWSRDVLVYQIEGRLHSVRAGP